MLESERPPFCRRQIPLTSAITIKYRLTLFCASRPEGWGGGEGAPSCAGHKKGPGDGYGGRASMRTKRAPRGHLPLWAPPAARPRRPGSGRSPGCLLRHPATPRARPGLRGPSAAQVHGARGHGWGAAAGRGPGLRPGSLGSGAGVRGCGCRRDLRKCANTATFHADAADRPWPACLMPRPSQGLKLVPGRPCPARPGGRTPLSASLPGRAFEGWGCSTAGGRTGSRIPSCLRTPGAAAGADAQWCPALRRPSRPFLSSLPSRSWGRFVASSFSPGGSLSGRQRRATCGRRRLPGRAPEAPPPWGAPAPVPAWNRPRAAPGRTSLLGTQPREACCSYSSGDPSGLSLTPFAHTHHTLHTQITRTHNIRRIPFTRTFSRLCTHRQNNVHAATSL